MHLHNRARQGDNDSTRSSGRAARFHGIPTKHQCKPHPPHFFCQSPGCLRATPRAPRQGLRSSEAGLQEDGVLGSSYIVAGELWLLAMSRCQRTNLLADFPCRVTQPCLHTPIVRRLLPKAQTSNKGGAISTQKHKRMAKRGLVPFLGRTCGGQGSRLPLSAAQRGVKPGTLAGSRSVYSREQQRRCLLPACVRALGRWQGTRDTDADGAWLRESVGGDDWKMFG